MLLRCLSSVATPRVLSAQLRLWFNGWCTARRFQQLLGCRLGCFHGADSVEHYARCSRVYHFWHLVDAPDRTGASSPLAAFLGLTSAFGSASTPPTPDSRLTVLKLCMP